MYWQELEEHALEWIFMVLNQRQWNTIVGKEEKCLIWGYSPGRPHGAIVSGQPYKDSQG